VLPVYQQRVAVVSCLPGRKISDYLNAIETSLPLQSKAQAFFIDAGKALLEIYAVVIRRNESDGWLPEIFAV
jgi:hypothetical protein